MTSPGYQLLQVSWSSHCDDRRHLARRTPARCRRAAGSGAGRGSPRGSRRPCVTVLGELVDARCCRRRLAPSPPSARRRRWCRRQWMKRSASGAQHRAVRRQPAARPRRSPSPGRRCRPTRSNDCAAAWIGAVRNRTLLAGRLGAVGATRTRPWRRTPSRARGRAAAPSRCGRRARRSRGRGSCAAAGRCCRSWTISRPLARAARPHHRRAGGHLAGPGPGGQLVALADEARCTDGGRGRRVCLRPPLPPREWFVAPREADLAHRAGPRSKARERVDRSPPTRCRVA